MEKYPVEAWPSLFVIDPLSERAELKWLGALNVEQLEKVLDDGEYAVHKAWKKSKGGKSLEDVLAAADALDAAGKHAEAAARYEEVLADAPVDSPRRGRILWSLVSALFEARDLEGCARRARDLGPALPKGPAYANVAGIGLGCAMALPDSAEGKKDTVAALVPMLWQALRIPDLLADDRSGIYEELIEVLEAQGDAKGAKTLAAGWWSFLEGEARKAQTPEARAAFDPHRVGAAIKMGEPARAIPMLQATERDLPDDYNAPARLAAVYRELGRYDDALIANKRALAKVYGPRRLRVLEVESDLYRRKGDLASARKALDEAIAVANALPAGQHSDRQVEHLKKLIQTLEGGAPNGT
ncbi:MAG TPA: tetratricopeptide repeat protein [Myxococcaceae bacterium]|nr:tetratricopeptide repeat protein [Myxococcaceae bacterium]